MIAPVLPTFLDPIRRAVRSDRVTELTPVLAGLAQRGAFDSGELFAGVRDDRYARRLLWSDPDGEFTILAMTWAPGQGAPLHDHGGLWGAEVVIEGTMRETPFSHVDRSAGGRFRFTEEPANVRTRAEVGVVTPPREYHVFGNAGHTVARTIHVYSGDIPHCTMYCRESDGWWVARHAVLGFDA